MRYGLLLSIAMALAVSGFGQPEWVVHDLTSLDLGGCGSITLADIDFDGDPDPITASLVTGIEWWEERDSIWYRHPAGGYPFGYYHAAAADFNDDGQIDIVAASWDLGTIDLLTNLGGGGSWTVETLHQGVNAIHAEPADIDLDGDMDIVATLYGSNSTLLLRNTVQGWVTTQVGASNGPIRVAVADLNGDQEPDVAVTEWGGNEVKWWENLGNGDSWSGHLIGSGLSPFGLAAADQEGDGDIDLFASFQYSNVIMYFENSGSGDFGESTILTLQAPRDLAWGDINDDGFGDLLTIGLVNPMVWVTGPGWTPQTLPAADIGSAVRVADPDDDSDFDLFAAGDSSGVGYLRLWEQEGNGFPVQVSLIPHPQTLIVPPEGGSVVFDGHLSSELDIFIPGVQVWLAVRMPDGQETGPLRQLTLTLPPFANLWVLGRTMPVPAIAPPGQYRLIARAGWPTLFVEDSFSFTKSGVEGSVVRWRATLPEPERARPVMTADLEDPAHTARQFTPPYR